MLLAALLIIPLAYFFTELIGYTVHRLAHWRGSGILYRTHLIHHSVHYPPGKYLSSKYLGDLRTSFIWCYAAVFVPILAVLLYLLPWSLFVPCLLTMIWVAVINSVIHDSFHVEGHWLSRFDWHKKLGVVHHVHHHNVKKNLGIYQYFFDKLLGNFKRSETD